METEKERHFKRESIEELLRDREVFLASENSLMVNAINEELAMRIEFEAELKDFIDLLKFPIPKTVEMFLDDCNNFINAEVSKQTYDDSYLEFLKYFNDLKTITKHNLVVSINFTYGWMPTIFDFRSDKFIEAIEILNNAKNGVIPSAEQLELLKGLFNKSLVGTTKLLHFINPDKFAIWDSKVYRYLTGKEAYNHRIGNCEVYLKYLTFCNFLTQGKEYEKAHNSICDKLGYQMKKLRTAELIMYINGGKTKK